MGNEEDEEPLKAEIPRVRMNPKNPTRAERNKNVKIQDMLSTGVGVLLVSKVEVLVDNIVLNCWKKRKEKGRLPIVAFDCGFLTQEKSRHSSNSDLSRQQV